MDTAYELALSNLYKHHDVETFVKIKKYAEDSIEDYARMLYNNLNSDFLQFNEFEQIYKSDVKDTKKTQIDCQDFDQWHLDCIKQVEQDIITAESLDQQSISCSQDSLSHSLGSQESQSCKWTEQQQHVLQELMNNCQDKLFVQKEFNRKLNDSKTVQQIFQHWNRSQKPNIKKGRFTSEEDEIIRNGFYENLSTKQISNLLDNRTSKQILNRLHCLKLIIPNKIEDFISE